MLKERGILADLPVSLEHQHLAKRYVVRAIQSGGAVGDLGRYVTFTTEDGQPIEWLHPVEAIGVNGLHAVVVVPALVRVDMLRTGRTYDLLITQHRPGENANDGKIDCRWKDNFWFGAFSWSLGSGFVRKGQGQNLARNPTPDVLFSRWGGSQDTEAVSPRRFARLPGRSIATAVSIATMSGRRREEKEPGVRRSTCHSLTWLKKE